MWRRFCLQAFHRRDESRHTPPVGNEPRWLVFGGSGAVGRFALTRIAGGGARVVAVSRQSPAPYPKVEWRAGELAEFDTRESFDVIASLGPLDQFVGWLERTASRAPRIVALSSTSIHTKTQSIDAHERALAARLADAESRLLARCREIAADYTVLRPTLVYGAAADRNLSRIAQLARRLHVLPLPMSSQGLRQPVHADDVARAVTQAVDTSASANRRYDLPGGETLSYCEMAKRVCEALPEKPRVICFPWPTARGLARVMRALGRDSLAAVLARTEENLVFDARPAARDFGYSPRPFSPSADMFAPA